MGKITPISERGPQLRPPRPIDDADDCSTFNCGKPDLNDWLRSRAARMEGKAARTYVVCSGNHVVAYYCLAAGAVLRPHLAKAKHRQNTPDNVPVIVIGRLAVDERFQSQGLGKGMLKDAILKAIESSYKVGVRAILVHVIDETAIPFYLRYGFLQSPLDKRTLVLPIETAISAFSN